VAERAVVMAVAAYASKAAAEQDFHTLREAAGGGGGREPLTVALVEKGADGQLTVDRYQGAGARPACGVALLGGALLVLAAPLGLLFLVPFVATRTTWAGVGALVSRLWNDVPKGDLRRMSDLVEATQAALVVVGVDRTGEELGPLLARARTAVVSDLPPLDLDADYSKAIEEAEATGG
jgi:hypothetical protein